MDDDTTWLQRMRKRPSRREIVGFFILWLLLVALMMWAAHCAPADQQPTPIILHDDGTA